MASFQHQSALTLLPEWAEQEAVILAWPHSDTDWQPWLDEVQSTYLKYYVKYMKSILEKHL